MNQLICQAMRKLISCFVFIPFRNTISLRRWIPKWETLSCPNGETNRTKDVPIHEFMVHEVEAAEKKYFFLAARGSYHLADSLAHFFPASRSVNSLCWSCDKDNHNSYICKRMFPASWMASTTSCCSGCCLKIEASPREREEGRGTARKNKINRQMRN